VKLRQEIKVFLLLFRKTKEDTLFLFEKTTKRLLYSVRVRKRETVVGGARVPKMS
jgi:hypothetical protein